MNYTFFLFLILFCFACNSEIKTQQTENKTEKTIIPDTLNVAIPTPVAGLGRLRNGEFIRNGTYDGNFLFRTIGGISLFDESDELENRCSVLSYKVTWLASETYGTDTLFFIKGARLYPRINERMEVSKTGDMFKFEDIEIICDGDRRSRKADDFFIKIH